MIETILFDLDGTLTDSGPGIVNGVTYALRHFGIEVTDRAALARGFIGPPLSVSFPAEYGFSEERTREAIGLFREYYDEKGLYENRPYPGIPELLHRLREAGKRLIVATSKPLPLAKRVLRRFQLEQYFAYICGGALDESRNTKAAIIEDALKTARLSDLSQVVMVGDRSLDVIGAHANVIPCIGILYGGYGTREELEEARADWIAEDVAELEALLLR